MVWSLLGRPNSSPNISVRRWYDHIVVGAGTAGSVLASRLAENGGRVLLLDKQVGILGGRLSRLARSFERPPPTVPWARAHQSDYDHWAQATDEPRWRSSSLGQRFRRFEESLRSAHTDFEPPGWGGDFQRSVARVAAGASGASSTPSGWRVEGAGFWRAVAAEGSRSLAHSLYLLPAMEASGADGQQLQVCDGVRVSRIKVKRGHAVGVEFEGGGDACAGEVVLCAGTLATPQLLMLSGIGPREHLEAHGVPMEHHLPGVGANLQDQVTVFATEDGIAMTAEAPADSMHRTFGAYDVGSHSGWVPGAYIKSSPEAVREDIQLLLRTAQGEPSLEVRLLRPSAAGSVSLRSAAAAEPPLPRLDLLPVGSLDAEALAGGVRQAQAVLLDMVARDQHRFQDPAICKETLRQRCCAAGNPVGTCAMGEGEMAVVDGQLRVHGIPGLRVADASVIPRNLSADPHASVLALAEQAASFLLRDASIMARNQYGVPPVLAGQMATL